MQWKLKQINLIKLIDVIRFLRKKMLNLKLK